MERSFVSGCVQGRAQLQARTRGATTRPGPRISGHGLIDDEKRLAAAVAQRIPDAAADRGEHPGPTRAGTRAELHTHAA